MGDLGDLFDGLPGARRCLGVDDPDDLGTVALDRRLHLIGIEHLAVRPLDRRDDGAGAFGDVLHPAAEDAVDAHQHPVARLDQVDDDRLHPGRPGSRDRQRQPILGLKHVAEQVLGLVHQGGELGVEVADERRAECLAARADRRRWGRGP